MLNEFRPVGPAGADVAPLVRKALVLLAIPRALDFARDLAGRMSRPGRPVTVRETTPAAIFPLRLRAIREDEMPFESADAGGRECPTHSAG